MSDSSSELLFLESVLLLLLQGSPGGVVISVAPQGSNGPGDNKEILQLEFEGKLLDCDDDSADDILLFFNAGDLPLEFFVELVLVV